MIRQPTPDDVALAWWRAAISGENPPRHDGDPQPGFYMLRRVKGGPFIPARIFLAAATDPETGELAEDERIAAEVNGWPEDAEAIWLSCRPITMAEYGALIERHRTIAAMNDARRPIDLSETPIGPGGF